MKFYSTNNSQKFISFKEAVLNGIANDGGLYMPAEIPKLPNTFFSNINNYSFNEIAFIAAKNFVADDIPEKIYGALLIKHLSSMHH